MLSLIKKKYMLTSTQFQYMTFLPNPRGQVCVLIQSVTLHVGLHFFHLNSILLQGIRWKSEKSRPLDQLIEIAWLFTQVMAK